MYNAFRDARQYTVEFGVFRLPVGSGKNSSRSPQKQYYEPSTLPSRKSHTRRFSTAYQLESVLLESAKENETTQHQPRRAPSRKSTTLEFANTTDSPRHSSCKFFNACLKHMSVMEGACHVAICAHWTGVGNWKPSSWNF